MKIINNNNNLVKVKDVPVTGIFEFNNKIYLKTEDFYYESNESTREGCAVNLNEGIMAELKPDRLVKYYPNAELRLNGAI